MGGFVNRMFEFRSKPCFVWLARASSIDVHEGEQRRKQAGGGVFLFGYFILDKQNKVPRLEAKRDACYIKIILIIINSNGLIVKASVCVFDFLRRYIDCIRALISLAFWELATRHILNTLSQ